MYMSFLVIPVVSGGTELSEQTLKTWDAYIQAADSQMHGRLQGPFLWVDEAPDRRRRVRGSEILVAPIGPQNPKPIPSGLIHDWQGAAFISNAKLEGVLSVVRDYSDYKEFYKPTVVDSKSLGADGACDNYSMRVVNKDVVSETALKMEYQTCYFKIDDRRWYSITHTTRVQEILHYGRSDEQELPANHGSGYLWRLYSVARFEERDGGVYVEVEAIVLSRDVPIALRWVVNPIVRRVSRNSILLSLQQMETAVHSTEAARGEAKPSTAFASTSPLAGPK
jgi:hypothetical protein